MASLGDIVAVNCSSPPTLRFVDVLFKLIPVTLIPLTEIEIDADILLSSDDFALITQLPTPTALIEPDSETVATLTSLVDQIKDFDASDGVIDSICAWNVSPLVSDKEVVLSVNEVGLTTLSYE